MRNFNNLSSINLILKIGAALYLQALVHFEPFGCAQDKLCKKSFFIGKMLHSIRHDKPTNTLFHK